MQIINSNELLIKAKQGKYAIAAFNVENYEMAKAVIEECDELRSPVIIAASTNTLKYISHNVFVKMISALASDHHIPIVVHLDHGKKEEDVLSAIRNGFTSAMFDGSSLSFLDNVKITKTCKDFCNVLNVSLEGELGAISGKKGEDIILLTEPSTAVDFVKKTNVNSLAVAIGTCHGFYKKAPNLDYDRLKKISDSVDVPLVLHGASGLSNEQLEKCIALGISKINFATDLRQAFTSAVRSYLTNNPNSYDPKEAGNAGIVAVKEVVRKIILTIGSKGRADE